MVFDFVTTIHPSMARRKMTATQADALWSPGPWTTLPDNPRAAQWWAMLDLHSPLSCPLFPPVHIRLQVRHRDLPPSGGWCVRGSKKDGGDGKIVGDRKGQSSSLQRGLHHAADKLLHLIPCGLGQKHQDGRLPTDSTNDSVVGLHGLREEDAVKLLSAIPSALVDQRSVFTHTSRKAKSSGGCSGSCFLPLTTVTIYC